MAELLKVRGLRAGYGESVVIDGIDLSLDEGRSLALEPASRAYTDFRRRFKALALETPLGRSLLHLQ